MSEAPGMVNSGIELRLLLFPDGDARAKLLRSRPVGVARAFRGLEPDDLLIRLPLVFSICRQAQAAACSAAIMATHCEELPVEALRRYDFKVAVETLFEAVRALSLSWPGMFGILPDSEIAAVHSKGAALLSALSNDGDDDRVALMMQDYAEACRVALFGIGDSLPEEVDILAEWARHRVTAAASFFDTVLSSEWAGLELAQLGFLEDGDLCPLIEQLSGPDGESFAARPDLDGFAAETGALARCREQRLVKSALSAFGGGLLARLAARLAEAGRLIDCLLRAARAEIMPGQRILRAMTTSDGWGVGIVHSARGMLVHALRLEGGKVADFRILAPTEWNFHPDGVVVRALEKLGRYEGFGCVRNPVRLASLVAGAHDPCVPCNVFVERAEVSHA